jgi:hypothetical protein
MERGEIEERGAGKTWFARLLFLTDWMLNEIL